MESEFSHKVRDALIKAGYLVQRLESHSTGLGIPDMVAVGHNEVHFIELKSQPRSSINAQKIKVTWRPGQQAWAQQFLLHMMKKFDDAVITQASWTFVECHEGILLVRMDKFYPENIVYTASASAFKQESLLHIDRVLRTHSHVVRTKRLDRCMEIYLAMFGAPDAEYDLEAPDIEPADWDVRKVAEDAWSIAECWNMNNAS